MRCFDNLSTGHRRNLVHLEGKEGFAFTQGDIRSLEQLRPDLEGASAVVHLAALGSVPRSVAQPLESESVNLAGFLNVLEAMKAAGVKRIVYASSSSVYGDSPELPKQEGREGQALSPYAVTKRGDELYAGLYHRLFGTEAFGLRFFNIFGERQDPEGAYAAAIPKFIGVMLKGQPPVVNGDGQQTRDFTYVANAVHGILQALHAPASHSGQVYNIACGDACNLLDLLRKLQARLAKIKPEIGELKPHYGPSRAGDVRASLADITKAREQLGYAPRFSLDQGLDRAVPWYAENWSDHGEA